MILYLDTSALVKRYIDEPGTQEVAQIISEADSVGTSLVSRAETAAALAKAVRVKTLASEEATSALQIFRSEWPNFVRIHVTEMVVVQADRLAWEFGLRGYDAVQLASALVWKENMGEVVSFATFDQRLWEVAGQLALVPFPDDLPGMLSVWRRQ